MIAISQTEAVTNPEVALRRLGGDEKLLKTLAGFFLEDAPTLVLQLRQAYESGDSETVAMKAHSLKGLSSTFEAIPFMKLAAVVETHARSGNQLDVGDTLALLEFEFERLIQRLNSLLSE